MSAPEADGAPPPISARNISAGYDEIRILHGVSVAVAANEVLAIAGPNGAGKTTLIRVLAGIVRPDDGRVFIGGRDVTSEPTHARATRGLAVVTERRNLFRDMTVRENLVLGAYTDADGLADRMRTVYDLFPRLEERADQIAGTLSGGEAQMLAIGRALMSDPNVLLLDEPSLGLAPQLVDVVFDKIAEIADRGVAVIVAEQRITAATAIADRSLVLYNGRIVDSDADESGDDLLTQYVRGV